MEQTGFNSISLLLNAGIVVTFIVFAMALWLISREVRKKNSPPGD